MNEVFSSAWHAEDEEETSDIEPDEDGEEYDFGDEEDEEEIGGGKIETLNKEQSLTKIITVIAYKMMGLRDHLRDRSTNSGFRLLKL